MKALTTAIDHVLRAFITGFFFVLVACVVWQVFSRYVLASPSTFTDEMARFLFMWVALFGAAYTLGQRRHLAIDLMSMHLTGRAKIALHMVVLAVVAGFALVVMVYGGSQLVAKTLSTGQVSPALRIPMGYIYCAIPISGAIMLYYCSMFFFSVLRGHGGINPEFKEDAPVGGPLD